MRYSEFEELFSAKRMQKYLAVCNNDTRRAMTLYRYNLRLSQEMFTIISCFEVVLRNRIDKEMVSQRGRIRVDSIETFVPEAENALKTIYIVQDEDSPTMIESIFESDDEKDKFFLSNNNLFIKEDGVLSVRILTLTGMEISCRSYRKDGFMYYDTSGLV